MARLNLSSLPLFLEILAPMTAPAVSSAGTVNVHPPFRANSATLSRPDKAATGPKVYQKEGLNARCALTDAPVRVVGRSGLHARCVSLNPRAMPPARPENSGAKSVHLTRITEVVVELNPQRGLSGADIIRHLGVDSVSAAAQQWQFADKSGVRAQGRCAISSMPLI